MDRRDVTEEILNTDPLVVAESITGKSYKEDEDTKMLGLYLHLENNKLKEKMLEGQSDTYWSMTWEYYLDILDRLGFKVIYECPFVYDKYEKVSNEMLVVHWHEMGIMTKATSWGNISTVNGASMFYCIRVHKDQPNNGRRAFSSGTYHVLDTPGYAGPNRMNGIMTRIWCGSHDIREGLQHNLNNLMEIGKFIKKWPSCPIGFHIGHYGEKGDDEASVDKMLNTYSEKILNHFDKLPKEIQRLCHAAKEYHSRSYG